MAISSQRLIIIVIAINMIFGVVITHMTETMNYEYNNEYISTLENQNIEFYDQFGNATPDSQSVQLQQTFGDTKGGGSKIFSILKNGVGFIEVPDYASQTEKMIMSWIRGIIIILNLILVLELYFIFINRKNT